jgi:purine-binding chemotaxis protein CheW
VNGTKLRLGLIVDEVNVVTDVNAEEIDIAPSFGTDESKDFIMAMVKSGESVYILLNLSVIMTPINDLNKMKKE